MRKIVYTLAFLLIPFFAFACPGMAQAPGTTDHPTFLTFVDTAGVAPIGPDIYVTWIFAMTSPTSFPSSGILVAFDCQARKVARLKHVVYRWNADSTGVEGPIVDDPGTWVDVKVPETFDLVCRLGREHAAAQANDEKPQGDPKAPGGSFSIS